VELLDRGAEAEIYAWGAGRVLRLILAESATSGRTLDVEAEAMRQASAAGVPVPVVHELVTVEGRPGMVMERIDGAPMLASATSRPWQIPRLARQFGEIHATLHRRAAPAGMTSVHDAARRRIERLEPTDAWMRSWVDRELEQLPSGTALMHGDFHPGNVLVDERGPHVIDWTGVAMGPPEADVARTLVLVETAVPPTASWFQKLLIGVARTRVFVPGYLRGYRRRRELDTGLLRRWRMVRAIERLSEAPTSERPTVRRMIRDAGGPPDFAPPL
jgi:aminoglycoside phosphotransferase (APT) family kinase protein